MAKVTKPEKTAKKALAEERKKKELAKQAEFDKQLKMLYKKIDELKDEIELWGYWHRMRVMQRRGHVYSCVGAAARYGPNVD